MYNGQGGLWVEWRGPQANKGLRPTDLLYMFQYEHDAEVDQLRALLVPPTDPGVPDEPSSKVEDLER